MMIQPSANDIDGFNEIGVICDNDRSFKVSLVSVYQQVSSYVHI